MRLTGLLSLLLLSFQFLFGQMDSIIKTAVYYDPAPPATRADSLFGSVPNTIVIDFMEGFNDSVYIFQNEQCIDTLLLVTNESLGLAGSIGICFKDKMDTIDLAIRFKSSGAVIRERLNLNFKHLQIRRLGKWQLYYSNHFPMLE